MKTSEVDRIEADSKVDKQYADGSYLALETLTLSDNQIIYGKSFRFNIR